jgi:hypothetical protein
MRTARISVVMVLASGLIAETGTHIGALAAQAPRTLTSAMPTKVANRQMQPLLDGSRRGLTLDAKPGDGVAWWPDATFSDGTIELDLKGKNVPQQSFVGVAFHGVDEKTFDAIYFRPFNFKAANPDGRSHAVQYVSHPTYTWDKLRAEHPGQYEGAIPPAPDPDTWFHARIVVAYPQVRVFVNDAPAPVLEVKQISDRKAGWVGVWVGNNSDGAFANLAIRGGQSTARMRPQAPPTR